MISAPQRWVIAITGATGVIYGIRLLEVLRDHAEIETHLVLSKPAIQTIAYETDWKLEDVKRLADRYHPHQNIASSLASGSFLTRGMIVAPCTAHTLACIAHGISDNLILRAADVTLKERRRLVLMFRETPLHVGHLENMLRVTQMGAIVAPPLPAFYHRPQTLEEVVNHSVGRLLDLVEIENNLTPRWQDSGIESL